MDIEDLGLGKERLLASCGAGASGALGNQPATTNSGSFAVAAATDKAGACASAPGSAPGSATSVGAVQPGGSGVNLGSGHTGSASPMPRASEARDAVAQPLQLWDLGHGQRLAVPHSLQQLCAVLAEHRGSCRIVAGNTGGRAEGLGGMWRTQYKH